ncbi:MAG TPA: serine hydrolase domain-containing protein [Gemmatimonadales bacterium]|jgi:CubicO group peptidase (beta-lactamase class C family)|nr:serine hydrolase domain-containing protein [Gemmatimonadales bacterium]
MHSLRLLALVPLALFVASPAWPQSFDEVDGLVEQGVHRGLYPGAVVVIGRRDSLLYARGYGHFTWQSGSPVPTPDSTFWDIASITKVMGTTSAIMRLVDTGRLDLDAPVRRYLPRFAGGLKDQVTVRMLLDHTSGLRSYAPLFKQARTREGAIELLYTERPNRRPGDLAVYSDLNAIFLGLIVESISKLPLDRFVTREVFEPLGLEHTTYHPGPAVRRQTMPSALWRGHPIQGQVNDPNAAILGGAAGHAGIFATGMDLARYAQVWLRDGVGPNGQWVRPSTIKRFLTRGVNSGPRLLGWDTPELNNDEPSLYGTLISDAAYGHTGFTGTEIWIDPTRDLFLVFLTNRTFDPRARDAHRGLRSLRTELSDAAIRLVPHTCQQELVAHC